MARKCGICNSINSSDSIYCKKCGSFLYGGSGKENTSRNIPKSIWELDREARESKAGANWGQAERILTGKSDSQSGRKLMGERDDQSGNSMVICPACGFREPVRNGQKPLFCSACAYIFQDGDKPIQQSDEGAGIRKPVGNTKSAESTKMTGNASSAGSMRTAGNARSERMMKRRGPMRSAGEDHSFLRLMGIEVSRPFAAEFRQEEGTLGTSGDVHPELFRSSLFHQVMPKQLKICHTPVGWYLQALDGYNVLNGDVLQKGVSRKLEDGDFINMGDCVLRAEIRREALQICSFLRLIGTSKTGSFIQNVRPEGTVLYRGSGSKPMLQVWYSANRQWCIRALSPMILLNGEELNTGFNRSISNGDIINADACILQVEIVENGKERG